MELCARNYCIGHIELAARLMLRNKTQNQTPHMNKHEKNSRLISADDRQDKGAGIIPNTGQAEVI